MCHYSPYCTILQSHKAKLLNRRNIKYQSDQISRQVAVKQYKLLLLLLLLLLSQLLPIGCCWDFAQFAFAKSSTTTIVDIINLRQFSGLTSLPQSLFFWNQSAVKLFFLALVVRHIWLHLSIKSKELSERRCTYVRTHRQTWTISLSYVEYMMTGIFDISYISNLPPICRLFRHRRRRHKSLTNHGGNNHMSK